MWAERYSRPSADESKHRRLETNKGEAVVVIDFALCVWTNAEADEERGKSEKTRVMKVNGGEKQA